MKLTLKFTIFFLSVFFVYALSGHASGGEREEYCVADIATPVLNTPDFSSVFGGKDGKSVKTDDKTLIREMEFIALPGTVFRIHARHRKNGHDILLVTTDDYPYKDQDLYIDSRFVTRAASRPANRKIALPEVKDILTDLAAMEGAPYMWGGNVSGGIKEMTEFYEPKGRINETTLRLWRLEGVDCSGLIYQASDGYTPRNTSSLVNFGRGLNIGGLSASEIASKTRPLDLIVWPGHVIIVIDGKTVIESSAGGGVKKSDLVKKLEQLMSERKASDTVPPMSGKFFVIRRWHPSYLRN
jgi:hypothetical protein